MRRVLEISSLSVLGILLAATAWILTHDGPHPVTAPPAGGSRSEARRPAHPDARASLAGHVRWGAGPAVGCRMEELTVAPGERRLLDVTIDAIPLDILVIDRQSHQGEAGVLVEVEGRGVNADIFPLGGETDEDGRLHLDLPQAGAWRVTAALEAQAAPGATSRPRPKDRAPRSNWNSNGGGQAPADTPPTPSVRPRSGSPRLSPCRPSG